MGDRSSIVIRSKQFATPISFYGHWAGTSHIEAVRNVLARTDRVGDANYLAAQIFWEFAVNLNQYDGKLSFGIGAFENTDDTWDNHPSVYVDADTGEIEYAGEDEDEDEEESED